MSLTIDLYANDGSPLRLIPPDIYGRGVGGAELAMMSWAETMVQRGHRVRIYNNPVQPGTYDGVEYLPQSALIPHEYRDVFIAYRSPNPHVRHAKAGVKIHWTTDQQTMGDFARDVFPFVDKVVTISPYHTDYHRNRYGVENGKIGHIDLGVRLQDYQDDIDKIPGRCIFCSVPERGLEILRHLWPRIKEQAPWASLVITSDYRLWGAPSPMNHNHRMSWIHQPDVAFLGAIPREQLVLEQAAAECMPYPCTYDELFCISAAECQAVGAVPITSQLGALPTTNEWGEVLAGNPAEYAWQEDFVSTVAGCLMTFKDLGGRDWAIDPAQPRRRFDWQRICEQWEILVETGEF